MPTYLKYEKELKQALTKLSEIQESEDKLLNEKEVIRQSVKQWLLMNELTSYVAVDLNNQSWSISLSEQIKTSFDRKMAEEILTEEVFNRLMKSKKIEVFRCQKINSNPTKNITKKMPIAPSENI